MFRTVIVAASIIAMGASYASAQTPPLTPADRIARSLELDRLLEDAQLSNTEAARAQVQTLLAELRNAGLPDSVLADFAVPTERIVAKLAQAWDPKEAARIYAEELAGSLTQAELDEADRYYESAEGKKAYKAIAESQAKMLDYINTRTNAVLQAEMGAFLAQIKEAAIKSRTSKK